jgi:hypothetical protein
VWISDLWFIEVADIWSCSSLIYGGVLYSAAFYIWCAVSNFGLVEYLIFLILQSVILVAYGLLCLIIYVESLTFCHAECLIFVPGVWLY